MVLISRTYTNADVAVITVHSLRDPPPETGFNVMVFMLGGYARHAISTRNKTLYFYGITTWPG